MDSGTFPALTVKRHDVVAAALPMQEHWLAMSNLDLLLPPLDFGIFLCYRRNQDSQYPDKMVSMLKKALAETLVTFYPFAGEIVANHHNEPEILCNNHGVDFVHACVDVGLMDLDLHHPDLSVHGRLVPTKMHGVLAVQVTELKCGGVVIGCTFDHRVADAHSANMFLTAWAEVAQSKRITLLPTFRRSLLNPRRPPLLHKSLDKFYVPLSSLPPPTCDENPQDRLTSRIYYVKCEEIDRIQSQSSCINGSKRSRIESFSAFLWKSIAGSSADAHLPKSVKLGIVIDGRSRLMDCGNGEVKPLERYFGNVLSIPYIQATVSDLRAASLESVAEAVHGCLAASATAEHFTALIDWVELRRPKPAVVKVYCKDENDEAAVVVSSGQRFPVSDLDFGWGGPVFGSYHFPWGGDTGYVMPMPSANGDGGWIVYMHLMGRHLDLLEERAPHVFIPFNRTYLSCSS